MTTSTNEGYEKLREANAKLKKDIRDEKVATVDKEAVPTDSEAMKGPLAVLKQSSDLMKMYAESSKMGSENVQGSLPMLKIHTTNKSQGNELADGKEPNDGWFYLTVNQEQFQNPVCHILTISKGFRAEGMKDSATGKTGEDKFNQILGGVIVDGKNYKPFVMYFTGLRLSRLWDFGKEVSKYTHLKPVGIPMFALSVKLSTEKVKHAYGSSYVVNFEVLRDDKKNPVIITDPGEFVFLRDSLESLEDTIASLISAKSTEENIQAVKNVDNGNGFDSAERPIEDIVMEEEAEKLPWDGTAH